MSPIILTVTVLTYEVQLLIITFKQDKIHTCIQAKASIKRMTFNHWKQSLTQLMIFYYCYLKSIFHLKGNCNFLQRRMWLLYLCCMVLNFFSFSIINYLAHCRLKLFCFIVSFYWAYFNTEDASSVMLFKSVISDFHCKWLIPYLFE